MTTRKADEMIERLELRAIDCGYPIEENKYYMALCYAVSSRDEIDNDFVMTQYKLILRSIKEYE